MPHKHTYITPLPLYHPWYCISRPPPIMIDPEKHCLNDQRFQFYPNFSLESQTNWKQEPQRWDAIMIFKHYSATQIVRQTSITLNILESQSYAKFSINMYCYSLMISKPGLSPWQSFNRTLMQHRPLFLPSTAESRQKWWQVPELVQTQPTLTDSYL